MIISKVLPKKVFSSIFIFCLFLIASCSNSSKEPYSIVCTTISSPCLQGKAKVKLFTERGEIVLQLDGDSAPVTAGNFLDLINRGVYDGTVFHKVFREPIPFVLHGGDPTSKYQPNSKGFSKKGGFIDPNTGQVRFIPLEIKLKTSNQPIYSKLITNPDELLKIELKHVRGALAMARAQALDSASAQFFITLRLLPELDGRYAVFGRVIDGMNVLDKIKQGDRIINTSYLN